MRELRITTNQTNTADGEGLVQHDLTPPDSDSRPEAPTTPDRAGSASKLAAPLTEARLGTDVAAAHLGLPASRLEDGVRTGEYPASDPQGRQPFSMADLATIRVIDRLRREAEDREALAASQLAIGWSG